MKEPDIQYVPTPQPVVDEALRMVAPSPQDVLYELGVGDGRFVVTAARRYHCRCVGVDCVIKRITDTHALALEHHVEDLIELRLADLFNVDLSQATIVFAYLSPVINRRLLPQFERLPRGARIITSEFWIPGVVADQVNRTDHLPTPTRTLYLYRLPLKLDQEA